MLPITISSVAIAVRWYPALVGNNMQVWVIRYYLPTFFVFRADSLADGLVTLPVSTGKGSMEFVGVSAYAH